MLNQKNVELGKVRSSIRELFEYGKKRKAEIGEEKVFDFSIGNPSVPAPPEVRSVLAEIIENTDPVELHGYTSAQGNYEVRKILADYTNKRFNTSLNADCFYMTCGAAASLTIALNALLNDGDEVIAFTPFFPEYRVFVENAGGKFITAESENRTFQINFKNLENSLKKSREKVYKREKDGQKAAAFHLSFFAIPSACFLSAQSTVGSLERDFWISSSVGI